jgi:ATP-dependent DNA helicase RecQ
MEMLIKSILRTYGGIFEHLLKIDTTLIANKTSLSEEEVISSLHQIHKDGIVEFHFSNTDSEITWLQPREDDKTINRIATIVEQQYQLKVRQVEAVLNYINNDKTCKNRQLLHYFGEELTTDCGICSVCLSKKTSAAPDFKILKNSIILALEKRPLSSRQLIAELGYKETLVLEVLKVLMEHDIIEITATNTYKIKYT